jgi:hypothetical protein
MTLVVRIREAPPTLTHRGGLAGKFNYAECDS